MGGRYSDHSVYLFIVLLLAVAQARIQPFQGKQLEEGDSLSNKIVFLTVKDSFIGNTPPSFSVNQTFLMKDASATTDFSKLSPLYILFYSSSESSRVGTVYDDGILQLCCTAELVSQGKCTSVGTLLISGDQKNGTVFEKIEKSFTSAEQSWQNTWDIKYSGTYQLRYINCEGSGLGDIEINGPITYINPFGQLSAEAYPLLWFFGVMTFVLIIHFTVWGVLNLIHRNSLISLQHFLTLLLVLQIFECFSWFLMLLVINHVGHIRWLWLTGVVLISSIKRAGLGLLMLLISLGYGIMNKARIQGNRRMICLTIGFYFLVSTGQELITTYIREGVVNSDWEILLGFVSLVLLFPSIVIPLGLFWLICSSLVKTIQKVKLRKQETKLEFYSKLLVSLVVAALVTVLMILLQTMISIVDNDGAWRVWWIFTAYWFVMFYLLSANMMHLLRPSLNDSRFAYIKSGLASTEEFDAQNVEMEDIDTINFDFELGLDSLEEEVSKIS